MVISKTRVSTETILRRMVMGITSASLLFSTTLTPLAAQGISSAPPPGVVSGQMGNVYSAEELDSILAPIALYPDQLLTQILMASAFPDQVAEASGWTSAGGNRTLRGEALDQALRPIPWDPAVKSLIPFPQVLTMLASHTDWMAQLAFAVAEQEAATFDSVQRLRRQARLAGYLRSTSQQVVRMDGELIVIVPVSPSVVYVPVYNPQVVYGHWADPTYPPYYFPPTYSVPGNYLATGIFFGVGVVVVGSLWGWATPRWRDRHFHVDPRRYDYFRQNYRAPPGDWHRWERDQWRPPARRGDGGQVRPVPPRPSDHQFRPPVQRPGEGPMRPGAGQLGERPIPPRPGQGQGQIRPTPNQPGETPDRAAPRPGQGQMRPAPVQPGAGQDRPMPPRAGPEQSQPMQRGPDNSQARPMPRQESAPQGRTPPAGGERAGRPAPSPAEQHDRPGQHRREN